MSKAVASLKQKGCYSLARAKRNLSQILRPRLDLILFNPLQYSKNKSKFDEMVLKFKEKLILTKEAVAANFWIQKFVQVFQINSYLTKIYFILYIVIGGVLLGWNILNVFSSKPVLVLYILAILWVAVIPFIISYLFQIFKIKLNFSKFVTCIKAHPKWNMFLNIINWVFLIRIIIAIINLIYNISLFILDLDIWFFKSINPGISHLMNIQEDCLSKPKFKSKFDYLRDLLNIINLTQQHCDFEYIVENKHAIIYQRNYFNSPHITKLFLIPLPNGEDSFEMIQVKKRLFEVQYMLKEFIKWKIQQIDNNEVYFRKNKNIPALDQYKDTVEDHLNQFGKLFDDLYSSTSGTLGQSSYMSSTHNLPEIVINQDHYLAWSNKLIISKDHFNPISVESNKVRPNLNEISNFPTIDFWKKVWKQQINIPNKEYIELPEYKYGHINKSLNEHFREKQYKPDLSKIGVFNQNEASGSFTKTSDVIQRVNDTYTAPSTPIEPRTRSSSPDAVQSQQYTEKQLNKGKMKKFSDE